MTALFTTMRVREGGALFWRRHLARLADGAARFGLPLPDEGRLRAEIAVAVGGIGDARVRVTLRPDRHAVEAAAYAPPVRPWRVRLVEVHPDEDTVRFKTTARAVYDEARRAAGDAHEALLVDGAGTVLEFTTANVFLVRDERTLVTPPAALPLLAGVARAALIEHAGLAVEERAFDVDELRNARSVLATNALLGVHDVAEIVGIRRFPEVGAAAELRDTLARQSPEERIIH